MPQQFIPKYAFNNHRTSLGLEIIPLERILNHSSEKGYKAHRLEFYQILVIEEGSGEYELDFETFELTANTIIPVAMGQVQRFSENIQAKGYALLFKPDFLIREEIDYHFLFDYTIFIHSFKPVCNTANERIYTLLQEMLSEQTSEPGFDSSEYQCNLLKNFLIQLERNKRDNTEIVCDDSLVLYMKFRRLVESNVSYKLRVNDLGEQLGASSKQINAAIKLFTGNPAKQYIEDRVILEAKRLLAYTTLSVKEIAYEIGFDDPTNFTKYFKARTNLLPRDYQKQAYSI